MKTDHRLVRGVDVSGATQMSRMPVSAPLPMPEQPLRPARRKEKTSNSHRFGWLVTR